MYSPAQRYSKSICLRCTPKQVPKELQLFLNQIVPQDTFNSPLNLTYPLLIILASTGNALVVVL